MAGTARSTPTPTPKPTVDDENGPYQFTLDMNPSKDEPHIVSVHLSEMGWVSKCKCGKHRSTTLTRGTAESNAMRHLLATR